mgnify:CR=1 FL=1
MTEKKLPISVVLLTRNEEANITACLESCEFAQEIVVIDDGSVDQTVRIAEEMGAKVFLRSMNGDWGAQQTYGISQTTNPWIFLLDADERVTPHLQRTIRDVVESGKIDASYEVQRENHFVSGQASHGVVRPDWVLRLMPRDGASVVGKVHPAIVTPYESKRLKGRLIHFPYSSWDSYFRKFDKYTKLAAEKYLAEGKSCNFVQDILLRPLWAFFKVYFINRGFLDGKLGFIFSVNHYFYTMAKYVRYYYLKNYGGKI